MASILKSRNTRLAAVAETKSDPLWLNLGMYITAPTEEDPAATKFVRLPRGVCVADLVPKKIYQGTSEQNRSEITLINQVLQHIQDAGSKLTSGESIKINLDVELYHRQDDIVDVTPATDNAELKLNLFD